MSDMSSLTTITVYSPQNGTILSVIPNLKLPCSDLYTLRNVESTMFEHPRPGMLKTIYYPGYFFEPNLTVGGAEGDSRSREEQNNQC